MLKSYENEKNKLLTSALDDGCQSFFEDNGYILELAYCKLIREDLEGAKKLFASINEQDIRAHWGLLITNILTDSPALYPTYFEIRNFLEIDLNILINYGKGNYVEQIANYAEVFSSVNLESNKYIGRVFWNNNLQSFSKHFLERAKTYFYNDPELHFLLACVHETEGNIEKTLNALDNCLGILPEYFPALNMKRKLIENHY